MRIAQVSPLYESVPPKLYGGTERVVAHLTEALVDAGHDVTLFASGDSTTRARLEAVCPEALRLASKERSPLVWHTLQMQAVVECSREFDVIHFHTDFMHFPIAPMLAAPHLVTLHGRLDLEDLPPLYAAFPEEPLVSISDAQRAPLPDARWIETVQHGLPIDLYRLGDGAGGYLAFLGRISPEKRVDRAIEIAQRAGLPLKIAAKVDAVDREYFERDIAHLFELPGVEYLGEVDDGAKQELLGNALGLLFPIDWPEPFGLTMIEAMACGTPVIAFRNGSVVEVVDEGLTGFVVDDIEEAVAAVATLPQLVRADCRAQFERRFTSARMASDYVALYERLKRRSAANDGRLRSAALPQLRAVNG